MKRKLRAPPATAQLICGIDYGLARTMRRAVQRVGRRHHWFEYILSEYVEVLHENLAVNSLTPNENLNSFIAPIVARRRYHYAGTSTVLLCTLNERLTKIPYFPHFLKNFIRDHMKNSFFQRIQ